MNLLTEMEQNEGYRLFVFILWSSVGDHKDCVTMMMVRVRIEKRMKVFIMVMSRVINGQ